MMCMSVSTGQFISPRSLPSQTLTACRIMALPALLRRPRRHLLLAPLQPQRLRHLPLVQTPPRPRHRRRLHSRRPRRRLIPPNNNLLQPPPRSQLVPANHRPHQPRPRNPSKPAPKKTPAAQKISPRHSRLRRSARPQIPHNHHCSLPHRIRSIHPLHVHLLVRSARRPAHANRIPHEPAPQRRRRARANHARLPRRPLRDVQHYHHHRGGLHGADIRIVASFGR
jgi:hypothetical protein